MKIEKLPRDFVYTDRRTLDDFLRSDDLNKELYKVYLRVKDRPYYFKFDAEKAFNEAYRIMGISRDLYGDNDIGRLQTKGPADIFVVF